MAENESKPKYIWFYRPITNTNIKNHCLYRAVPYENRYRVGGRGGWRLINPKNKCKLKKNYDDEVRGHREKRERLSRS